VCGRPLGTEDRKDLTWNIIKIFMVLKGKRERPNKKKKNKKQKCKRKREQWGFRKMKE